VLPRVRFCLFTFQLFWKFLRRWCDLPQSGSVAIRMSARREV
jgi:hypothetical protein